LLALIEDDHINDLVAVLGQERVSALSNRQDKALSQAYKRLLDQKPVDQISDAEILGQYELVVDHLSPAAYEVRRRN